MFRRFHLLWRAETAVATARFHTLMRRSVLLALAALIAALGLCMLNIAAYFALQPFWGTVWAAVAVAAGDFLLAVIVALAAVATKQSNELNAAIELRQAAIDEFSGRGDRDQRLFGDARDSIDIALLAVAIPLMTKIIRSLRKKQAGTP